MNHRTEITSNAEPAPPAGNPSGADDRHESTEDGPEKRKTDPRAAREQLAAIKRDLTSAAADGPRPAFVPQAARPPHPLKHSAIREFASERRPCPRLTADETKRLIDALRVLRFKQLRTKERDSR